MSRFRFLIIAAALIPLLTVALVGLWLEPMSHLTLIGASTAGVLLSIALILYLSRNYTELVEIAQQVHESLQKDRETARHLVDPLAALRQRAAEDKLVQVLVEYGIRLSDRREQLRHSMKAVLEVFCQLADSKKPIPSLAEFSLADAADETLLQGSYHELAKTILRIRRRAKTFARFLAEFPLPIIVTNKQYQILSINLAGERMLGQLGKHLFRKSLLKLFADPALLEPKSKLALLGPEEVIVELMCGKATESLAALYTAEDSIVPIAVRAKFGHNHIFSFRELQPESDGSSASKSNWAVNKVVTIHS